jgi:hypothetical protein
MTATRARTGALVAHFKNPRRWANPWQWHFVQALHFAVSYRVAGGAGHVAASPYRSRSAFGRHPRAWSITIPATNLTTSEGLSPTAEFGMEEALRQIALLVGREVEEERSARSE